MLEEPFAAAEARRLEELHLAATELALEDDLDAGRHGEAIGRLRALVDEHPLRERLRALLMLALYRAGRQAEALDVFRDARFTLVSDASPDSSDAQPAHPPAPRGNARAAPFLRRPLSTADAARRNALSPNPLRRNIRGNIQIGHCIHSVQNCGRIGRYRRIGHI
jgi:hypothetical protein